MSKITTIQAVTDFVATRIVQIYERPFNYGIDANAVNSLLNAYHEIWAFVTDRGDDVRILYGRISDSQDCQGASLPERYRWDHANAPEPDVVNYVTTQWKKISIELGMFNPNREQPDPP